MEEICEIAKMFRADEIYNTGLKFIQSNIDPNFNVPDNKYEDQPYLTIGGLEDNIPINQEMSGALFNNNSPALDNYYKINDSNNDENTPNEITNSASLPANADQPSPQEQRNGINLDDHSALHDPVFGLDKASNNPTATEVNDTTKDEDDNNKELLDENRPPTHSVVYQVRVENHTFKCPIFKFVSDKHIVYTAKQKFNDVFIGEGDGIHISKKENHVGHIHQNISIWNTLTQVQ